MVKEHIEDEQTNNIHLYMIYSHFIYILLAQPLQITSRQLKNLKEVKDIRKTWIIKKYQLL